MVLPHALEHDEAEPGRFLFLPVAEQLEQRRHEVHLQYRRIFCS
jgi:hypothetical protein